MKNKKRISIILLTILSIMLILQKTMNVIDTKRMVDESETTNILIQDMPIVEETRTWETSERFKLKAQAEHISIDSCEMFFRDEINHFLSEYENVKLESLMIKQDSLSVIEGKNQKSLRNLDMEVNLMVDTTNNVESYDFAAEVSDEVDKFLGQYSYIVMKMQRICINVLDQNSYKIHNLESHYSQIDEVMFVEQEEDEYAVQTLAFQFAEKNPEFVLRKFGKISESKELYVEYKVDDDYFTPAELDKNIADLEKVREKIKEQLLSQKVTEEYISANQLERFTISFFNGIFDDSYQTFSFEL